MRSFIFILSIFASLPAFAGEKSILVLGDSLSTGYGIPLDQGWVPLLEERLLAEGYTFEVHNASITGETTAGAKVRIYQLLEEYNPEILVIELGGNDGLRGLQIDETRANLDEIIRQARNHGAQILLIPMALPVNYGPRFNEKFTDMYRQLSEIHAITMGTFILEGIGDNPDLMQSDGIHPTAAAQPAMLENVWKDLVLLLNQAGN